MRIGSTGGLPWPINPEKGPSHWDENLLMMDLPKTAGVEKKQNIAVFSDRDGQKKIHDLADNLGLDHSRMIHIDIHWILHDKKNSKEASALMCALLRRITNG